MGGDCGVSQCVAHPWQRSFTFEPHYEGLHLGRKLTDHEPFRVPSFLFNFPLLGKQPSEYSDKYNLKLILNNSESKPFTNHSFSALVSNKSFTKLGDTMIVGHRSYNESKRLNLPSGVCSKFSEIWQVNDEWPMGSNLYNREKK